MNPLDARESEETYEYPARPYTLPMRPVQSFRVLSESGDVPAAQAPEIEDLGNTSLEDLFRRRAERYGPNNLWPSDEAWSDKYLTAEDARVLRQDGI